MAKGASAENLFRALRVLITEMDRDLPLTIPFVFMRIASQPNGVDQKDLMDELKIGSSQMSRTVQTLADVHYLKEKPGLGLIDRVMDLTDNRKRTLRLSAKGERLMAKIIALG